MSAETMGEISSNNNSDACIIILRNRYKHDKQKFTNLIYWNTNATVKPLLIQIRRLTSHRTHEFI